MSIILLKVSTEHSICGQMRLRDRTITDSTPSTQAHLLRNRVQFEGKIKMPEDFVASPRHVISSHPAGFSLSYSQPSVSQNSKETEKTADVDRGQGFESLGSATQEKQQAGEEVKPKRSSMRSAFDKAKRKLFIGSRERDKGVHAGSEEEHEKLKKEEDDDDEAETQTRKEEYERLGLGDKIKFGQPGGMQMGNRW